MEVKQDKTRSRAPLWLRILLAVSLALNLLVLGLVGGAMLRFGGPDGMRPPPRSIGATLFRELPREDRNALLSRPHGSHGDRRARLKADALAVSTAMRATPFDQEALKAILDTQATHREGLHKSVQQAWLTRVANMSDAKRRAYADRLDHALSHPRFKERSRKKRP